MLKNSTASKSANSASAENIIRSLKYDSMMLLIVKDGVLYITRTDSTNISERSDFILLEDTSIFFRRIRASLQNIHLTPAKEKTELDASIVLFNKGKRLGQIYLNGDWKRIQLGNEVFHVDATSDLFASIDQATKAKLQRRFRS